MISDPDILLRDPKRVREFTHFGVQLFGVLWKSECGQRVWCVWVCVGVRGCVRARKGGVGTRVRARA